MSDQTQTQANPSPDRSAARSTTGLWVALGAFILCLGLLLFRPAPEPEAVRINDPEITASELRAYFDGIDYQLDGVRAGEVRVSRIDVATMPHDLGDLTDIQALKDLFFSTVLPLVLMENERIEAERAKVQGWLEIVKADGNLRQSEIAAINALTKDYKMIRLGKDMTITLTALLRRMDVIPASLALAQAAEESAWGRSRFARDGNALFGQWVWNDQAGMTPEGRKDGETHSVRAFADLNASVVSYINNLNTHRAYASLRATRETLREQRAPITGAALVGHLTSYSERREAYVDSLRSLMDFNELADFDGAELSDEVTAFPKNAP